MSGASLLALALREGENDNGADAKERLRQQIAKGNLPEASSQSNEADTNDTDNSQDDDGDNEDGEANTKVEDPPEETEEQKTAREAKEKVAAKEKRKEDRMQRRIDEATARAKTAEDELKKFKEANPDSKLSEAEVEARAAKIAADKLAEKQATDIQKKFDDACAKLAKDAIKIDKDFDQKVEDMAEQFGPIPSFMIGVLEDFDNGAEVLALMASDDDIAEKIYNLKSNPAKMTKELVLISNKLEDEKKKKNRRQISRVPDPVEQVNGSRAISTVITEADTKDMNSYVTKRRMQQEAARKARGW